MRNGTTDLDSHDEHGKFSHDEHGKFNREPTASALPFGGKPRCVLLGAIPVCILLASQPGCSRGEANKASAAVDAQSASAPRIAVVSTQLKTLRRTSVQPARLLPFEEAPLFPKVTGYVERVEVDIGDQVHKDQTLLRIWIPELNDEVGQKEALVAQAKAEVALAHAAVHAAGAAIRTAEALVGQETAGLGRAEGEYERWKAEFDRISELAKQGSVTSKLADETRQQYRSADAAKLEAAARIQSAEAKLAESRALWEKSKADEAAAGARLKVAQADLDRLRTLLAYSEIKAPFDGTITYRGIHTGHFVHPKDSAGSKPLLVVARRDLLRVEVDLPELEAAWVDPGDVVTLRVQALGGREFSGKVARTSWALNPANRSLRAEVDLPNPQGVLRPGMFATAIVLLEERNNVPVLPLSAISTEAGQNICCCVVGGKLVRKPVTLGLRAGDEVEVLSGLGEGETALRTNDASLAEGQAIHLAEAQSASK